MALVDYEYYIGRYLLGKSPVITGELFPYWEKQAEAELQSRTFGRITQMRKVPDAVRDCICAVAELQYQADTVQQQALSAGAAGPLSSFSNDGESGTYDLTQSDFTASGTERKTQDLVRKYLLPTGLLYAGVGVMG